MTATADEKRGYTKGYAAGCRRSARFERAETVSAMREEFERQVFLAVLPELLARPWQVNGEAWKSMEQFVDGAAKFARKSSAKFAFTPFPLPTPPAQTGEGE